MATQTQTAYGNTARSTRMYDYLYGKVFSYIDFRNFNQIRGTTRLTIEDMIFVHSWKKQDEEKQHVRKIAYAKCCCLWRK